MKVCSKCGSPFGEYGVCPNCGSTQFREVGGARQNNSAQNSAQSAPQGVPVNNAGAQSAPQGAPVNSAGAQYANVNVPPQNGAPQYNQNAPQGAQMPPQNGVYQGAPQGAQMPPQGAQMPPQGAPFQGSRQPDYIIPGQNPNPPLILQKTDRSFWAYFGLSIITLGIYHIITMVKMTNEFNKVSKNFYHSKMMNWFLAMILGCVTVMIYPLVWYNQFSDRIGEELERRNIDYEFSNTTFWLWFFLGSLILVGPFVYMAKLMKAMNLINESYNYYGPLDKSSEYRKYAAQSPIVINVNNNPNQ